MASQRGFMQGTAALAVAGVSLGLVFEQKLHADRVIFLGRRGRQQHRLTVLRLRPGTTFQQEFGQPPVAGHAGDAQRGDAFMVERVNLGSSIAQQGGDAGIGTARGMVQRCVAFTVGGTRIGTVGQQRGDRVGAAVPAVTRRCQQGSHAGMGVVEVDALGNQRPQQAQVGQYRRQRGQAALVALAGHRQGVRIGTCVQQFQGALHPPGTCGGEQGVFQVLFAQGGSFHWLRRGHLHHRQAARPCCRRNCLRRGHALQGPVQQRQRQHIRHDKTWAPGFRQRTWPGQRTTHADHDGHQRRHAQAVPGVEITFGQRAPMRGQRTTFAFQPMPQRPGAPQTDQQRAGHRTQAQCRQQAAALAQCQQRPGQQHACQQECRRPDQQQGVGPLQPGITRQQRARTTPPRNRQRQRRLGQYRTQQRHGTTQPRQAGKD